MSTSIALLEGAPVILTGNTGPIRGKISQMSEDLDHVSIQIEEGVGFFPFGYSPEKFRREGNMWRRIFPDPFTRKNSICPNERLYGLTFEHKAGA